MREILFKAKSTDDGSWVEGYICKGVDSFGAAWWIYRPAADPDHRNDSFYVDPSTVRQFTGLRDRSGARIFEGDILKAAKRMSCIPTGKLGYVKWSDVMCGYEIRTADGAYLLDAECGPSFDIVGNVFDDAALLRGDLND